ncbi:putative disease resistance protein RGA3 [Prunus avium]|uniref:Disease resistance protein RGA3 n=1 Tax=Prunus avium TaxID=42229 RepID=A0A6P5S7U3_PRUAV|nr:putative disease resistance protein RGA3 [Prunus avium]
MADALISMLLERLASTTYEYIEEGVKLALNVKEDVEKFTRTLQVIRAVLEDAEQRQVTDQAVKIWLDELKDISYQMVDVLDEWNTDILKQQVEKQESEGDPNALVTKKKIAKAISGDYAPSSNELDEVLQCMSRSIQGKKFLLVLDDVWTDDPKKWEQLKVPLIQSGAKGSRILVTTRKLEVANMMRATPNMINLEGLSDEYCLAIFNHMAFPNGDVDESKAFGDISKKFVRKCKGLPLAAKTLGSLMQNKRTMREWKEVLNSKIWDLGKVEQEVFQPLFLSYYDLSPTIKSCLLYCATFPEDYEFDRDDLIKLWMAQDYVISKGHKEKGTTGDAVFDNLVAQSFFQDFEKDSDTGTITSCKMHDIVHDFVQFLTRNECLINDYNEETTNESKILGDKVRHLTLRYVPEGPLPLSISSYNCKNLRTLATFDSRITTVDPNLISQLKCLRTLNLSGYSIKELPEKIGELIHLRHIDLSYNDVLEKLPDTICGLYNLSTLRFNDCSKLETLPQNMGNLINLKHIYVDYCNNLKSLPKGIGRLTSLQTVDVCQCGGDNDEAFQIGDLRKLNLEGRPEIQLVGDATDKSEWTNSSSSSVEILNALRPHPDLESLNIRDYNGTTWPNWMLSLHNLRFLSVGSETQCELWPLGKLESLETLTLSSMDGVRKVGVEFLGLEDQPSFRIRSPPLILFPKLKRLHFYRMSNWEEWEGVEEWTKEASEITIMPCLSELEIEYCNSLKALPDFLFKTPLQTLEIYGSDRLSERYEEGNGEWAKISATIPNISIKRRYR